jgi:hypothetical protein
MPALPKAAAPATTTRAQEAKAQRMIAKLRAYHKLGLRANQSTSDRTTKQFGEQLKLSESTMRKARAFARLYVLRRPNGLPLQWGHVSFLLCVADKSLRTELQQRAADEGWNSPELYAEIRRRQRGGPRRKGGRPVKVPTTPTACFRQIITEGQPWKRRCESLQKVVVKWKLKRAADRAMAVEAAAILEQLAQAAAVLAKRLKQVGR